MFKLPDTLVAAFPAAPPVIPPVTIGADHVYVIPFGTISLLAPFVIMVVNNSLLQAATVFALIDGLGLIVTVIVNGAPGQTPTSPDTGITVYTTV